MILGDFLNFGTEFSRIFGIWVFENQELSFWVLHKKAWIRSLLYRILPDSDNFTTMIVQRSQMFQYVIWCGDKDQKTYESKIFHYQFHKIRKLSKLITRHRVSRIRLYMDEACYLGSSSTLLVYSSVWGVRWSIWKLNCQIKAYGQISKRLGKGEPFLWQIFQHFTNKKGLFRVLYDQGQQGL